MEAAQHTIGQILVVEDFIDTLDIICKILKKNHFSTEKAPSLKDAFAKLTTFRPDVIILDINLPDGSGLDLLPKVKQEYPDTAVIMLTAYTDLENAIRSLQEGADDFITKPFETGYLLHSIRKALEKKRLKERLRQAEKFKVLGELAAGVAHDFNNVLHSIGTHCYLMDKRLPKDEESLRENLKAIEMSVRDGAAMVNRLRHMGRNLREDIEDILLNKMVSYVILMTKPKWHHEPRRKGRSIILRTELKDCPPVRVSPSEIREVLTNLIFNAVDAMPQGGELHVMTNGNDNVVWCKIKDTGIGMTQDVKERIFDPFFSTKGHGTGLGLSISFAIIQKYGGDIRVDSTPGGGTTFTIELPVKK